MANLREQKTFMVEDARLIFKNFAGKASPFNDEGERSFCVILDPEPAAQMQEDGWNVKFLEAREPGDEETPYINVRVNFKNRPPRVVMLTSTSRTSLNESSVETLDWADIEKADLIARGFEWDVQGKQGIKAYLQSLFVHIREDELERKYGINSPEGQAH